ncbi:MAG: amino acid ABC transporter permease [Clostridia bacterium]|nr:amino acid ABC transporter permease [Clostridia bacterium]MBQ2731121.1 amino acid ABC transporter permease [Clostridia bacterium]
MFGYVTQELLLGFWTTLQIFALTLLFSLPLGLVICFGSMSRVTPLRWFCKTLVWIIRGTPLMLQIIVIFYGPGLAATWAQGLSEQNALTSWIASWEVMDRFTSIIVAFSINYACYFSEIYRGGIQSIPRGQYEAGQVLGMTRGQIFFHVVLMQVIKRITAPMSNEFITLVKDTSLARTIAVYEIIWAGQQFITMHGLLWPLFYTGAFYLIFCGALTLAFGALEKKLNYYKV